MQIVYFLILSDHYAHWRHCENGKPLGHSLEMWALAQNNIPAHKETEFASFVFLMRSVLSEDLPLAFILPLVKLLAQLHFRIVNIFSLLSGDVLRVY